MTIMDKDIAVDWQHPEKRMIERWRTLQKMTDHKIRVRAKDIPRPCDRFIQHSSSRSVWVDIHNWIVLGKGYWSLDRLIDL